MFERGDPLLGEGGAQEHVDVRAHQDVAEQLKLVIALNSRKPRPHLCLIQAPHTITVAECGQTICRNLIAFKDAHRSH